MPSGNSGSSIRISAHFVSVHSGRLHFDATDEVPDGVVIKSETFAEKGIDVRIAVDVIRHFTESLYDVCVIFSRDRDLAEAVEEVKRLAGSGSKTVTIASAFPSKDGSGSGVPGTIHVRLDESDYDSCRDPNTHKYFPKS
jgi:hypothetical protein